jgi:hypothetical protein
VVQSTEAGESDLVEERRIYRPPLLGLGGLLFVLTGYLLFQGDSGSFIEDLSVRDCFQTPAEVEVASVEIVSCEDPHDEEVYAVKQLDHAADEPYTGLLALDESSFNTCVYDFQKIPWSSIRGFHPRHLLVLADSGILGGAGPPRGAFGDSC